MSINLAYLGTSAVILAFAVSLYALLTGILGARRRDARLQTSARFAAIAVFLAMSTALFAMEAALLSNDFSVQYVAQHSSPVAPTWVKVVMLWGALEGSILLWGWLLAAYTAVMAVTTPNTVLRPWALVVMQAVLIFFITVIAFVANPFTLLPSAQWLGPGPNPLLQNHWMMAVHPVLMYLGFVGLTVPFAFAMAALISKRPGSDWMQQTRRWTLAGWGFLTAAIIAGGWWSYAVLGWGGYWAWDPVENVSFMPWLTATAFLHSVQVQERRRMLKSWNMLLIVLTFALTILGTFLTRSGVLSSVHAFGDGPVGPAFLIFFIIVMLFAFGLVALRWDQVRDHAELDAPVSREGSFLLGNVFFLTITFTVLLGTLFPIIVEAISDAKVTIGAPFFDQVSIPIWLAIFALMGIGPLLPWRRAEQQRLRTNLLLLSVAGIVTGVIAFALGIRRVYPLLTIALAGYNLMSLYLLIAGVIRPRMKLSSRGVAQLFKQYAFENRRRFGSMVVHMGVIVIALGVMASSAYRVEQVVRVDMDSSTTFQGYELRAVDLFMERTPARISAGGVVEVYRGDRQVTTMYPKVNVFSHMPEQPVPTPDIHYTLWHDLYLNTSTVTPDQNYLELRMVQSPLVTWIWFGGVVMALGTAYTLVPSRRRETESVARGVTA